MKMFEQQDYCPVCYGGKTAETFKASSIIYTYTPVIELAVAVCEGCGSYYLQEYIKENEIQKFYPDNYYTRAVKENAHDLRTQIRDECYAIYKGYPVHKSSNLAIRLAGIMYGIFYWHRLGRFPRKIESSLPGRATVLEIGYGGGSYLTDLKRMGWDCYGVDPDQSNKERLEEAGIKVAQDPEALDLSPKSMDYIYSYHAFEHIYDIDSMFRFCRKVLSDNGLLKICVPVSDGLLPKLFKRHWYDLGVPIHKQIFSVIGLGELAERHGFEVKKVYFNSYSESFLGSIFAAVIALLRSKQRAQFFAQKHFFKGLSLVLAPLLVILDKLDLGDRVEVELISSRSENVV